MCQAPETNPSVDASKRTPGLFLAQHFLGHSPRTVATRSYVAPPLALFDEALLWLWEQYGF
jgi:hypothetical protein